MEEGQFVFMGYPEFVKEMKNLSIGWLKGYLRVKKHVNINKEVLTEFTRYLSMNLASLVASTEHQQDLFGTKNNRSELYSHLIDLWLTVNLQLDPGHMDVLKTNFDKSFPEVRDDWVLAVRTEFPFLLLFVCMRDDGILLLSAE